MRSSGYENYVAIGNPDDPPHILSLTFSPEGNLLFAGTKNYIFACKFSPDMRDGDCRNSLFLDSNQGIRKISVNSANKLAAASHPYSTESQWYLWVIKFTSEGYLEIENST